MTFRSVFVFLAAAALGFGAVGCDASDWRLLSLAGVLALLSIAFAIAHAGFRRP